MFSVNTQNIEMRPFSGVFEKFICAAVMAIALLFACAAASFAQAVTYTQTDIGNPGATGSYTYTAGSPPTFTIGGAGTGVGYTSDSLTFVSTPAAGSTELQCKVVSMTSSASTASAGLMMRDYLGSPYAAVAAIVVTPSSGVQFYYRTHGGAESTVSGPAVAAPIFLRLTNNAGTISGYSSTDGISWSLVGSASVPMTNLYYGGLTVSGASGIDQHGDFPNTSHSWRSVPQTGAGSNLLAWYRSDVGLTYAAGTVSAWADQSGNGNNATGTGAAQPGLVTGAINNAVLPAVSFNGTSQYMTLPSGFANLTNGFSCFVVMEPSVVTGTHDPFALGNASNSDAVFPQQSTSKIALDAYNTTTSSAVTSGTGALSSGSYQLVEATLVPGSTAGTAVGTVYVNGVQKATSSTMQNLNNVTRSSNYIGVGIGLSNYFSGNIAEILIYSAPVTSAQRAMVEAYCYGKFGIGNKPTLDAPVLSPQSGVVTPKQAITMSQDQSATIYYTGDGTAPGVSSEWYNSQPTNVPVYLPNFANANDGSITVNAIAVAPFFNNSSTTTDTYIVDPSTTAISRNGLICWLRADQGTTLVSGKVSSWNDSSGSGNSATQATAAKRPTFTADAINGLPALLFNGTSTFLQLPSPGFSSFTSGGVTGFLVTEPTAVTAGARFFDLGNGATADNIYLDEPTSTGASLYTYNVASGTSVTSSSAITLNQFQLLEFVDNGSGTATIFTNGQQGAQSTTMNTVNNVARTSNFIGQGSATGNFFKGYIAEMILYNRALSTSEIALIEGYLIQKYSMLSNATATPVLSVAAGTLTAPTQVAIWSPAGSILNVTTDGTTPTTSSPVYSGPLTSITHRR